MNSHFDDNVNNVNDIYQNIVSDVFLEQDVNLVQSTGWPGMVAESPDVYPCYCGVGFVPSNFSNANSTRASHWHHICMFDLHLRNKILCMETGANNAGHQVNTHICSIQVTN